MARKQNGGYNASITLALNADISPGGEFYVSEEVRLLDNVAPTYNGTKLLENVGNDDP